MSHDPLQTEAVTPSDRPAIYRAGNRQLGVVGVEDVRAAHRG